MNYKANSLMKKRLINSNLVNWAEQLPLEEKLKEILDQGIEEKHGVFFLRYFDKGKLTNEKIKELKNDLVGLEMNKNGFHIDMYIPENKLTSEYSLRQGISFALGVIDKLENIKKEDEKFIIIISTDEGEGAILGGCKLGFYKEREGQTWLRENLESYDSNGLLVFSI